MLTDLMFRLSATSQTGLGIDLEQGSINLRILMKSCVLILFMDLQF